MPISYSQEVSFTCPACGSTFTSNVWLILDVQEHPDQVDALLQQTLNLVTCPHCKRVAPAGLPFFFHDAQHHCIIFAAPPATEEYIWREQAHELHAVLIGSIPIEQRHAYLADVQIAQDIAGLKHMLDRMPRRTVQTTTPPPQTEMESLTPPPDAERLMAAVEALMSANTLDDVERIVATHPVLRSPAADVALGQLADIAFEQGEHATAEIVREVRRLLQSFAANAPAESSSTNPEVVRSREPGTEEADEAAPAEVVRIAEPTDEPLLHDTEDIPDEAYLALLDVHSTEQFTDLVQRYPFLLAPWVDDLLALRVEQVLEDGHEHLAHDLEDRRELLDGLRQERAAYQSAPTGVTDHPVADAPDPHLIEAVQALFAAEDEESIGQVLTDYPVLLTEPARQVLLDLASEAQKRGDADLATYAIECRAMLHEVSEGLHE